MAAYLSTSVEERDCNSSLIDLDKREELVEEFRPLLDGRGYEYINNSSNEEVDDHHLTVADPQNIVMTTGGNRLGLGQRNEDHYRAWLSVDADRTDLSLEEEQPSMNEDNIPSDVINQNFQEEVEPVSKNDLHGGGRCGEVLGVGATQAKKEYTRKEQAWKDFVPYTISLTKILLSDGRGWSFLLDDIFQIICDIMTRLVDLHAQSIVYSDMHVDKIFLNDHMRAFLIDSPESKKQSNKTLLIEESVGDVKKLCKIMGGLCFFYKRNKPPDSLNNNQEAETALFSLVRKGYRQAMTAEYFIEELRRIVVDGYESAVLTNKVPEPGSAVIKNKVPEDASAVINNKAPEAGSAVIKTKVPGQGPAVINNRIPEHASAVIKKKVPEHASAVINDKAPEAGSAVIKTKVPGQGPAVINNKAPEDLKQGSSGMDYAGPERGSPTFDIKSAEQGKECGDKVSEGLELRSGVLETYSTGDGESFTDEATTHKRLLSDLEMDIFLSN